MSPYNHTGQVVTDLERSKRFYHEVLGFSPWYEITPDDDATAKLMMLAPPLAMTASYLVLDGFVLELLHFGAEGATARHQPRAMNRPGLTHISISVDDIHATATKAVDYGGSIVDETDIGAALFIRDPDGQLIELLPTAFRDRLPPKPRPDEQ